MSHDPAAFHRALLHGVRPDRRERWPVPAAVLVAVAAEAVLGALGRGAADLAAWVVLGLVGSLGLVLLALTQLPPAAPRASHAGRLAAAAAAAAALLERTLLLAVCAALASALLAEVVAPLAEHRAGVAVVLVLVVAAAQRLARRPAVPARRRVLSVAGWCGAAVVTAAVVAGAFSVGPGGPAGVGTGNPAVSVLVAVAVGGLLLAPAVPRGHAPPRTPGTPRRPGRTVGARLATGVRRHARVLVAAAGIVAVLVVVGAGGRVVRGGRPALLDLAAAGGGEALATVLAVLLSGVLLLAAVAALSAVPPVRDLPGAGPESGAATATGVAVAAALAVVLASGDVDRLAACYAVVVLLLAFLALRSGRRGWRRALETLHLPGPRRRARRGRALTGLAAAVAGGLLVVAAVPGWPAVPVLALASAMMWGVSRHDRELRASLALTHAHEDRPLPTVVRAFVVVSDLDRSAVRAVTCARALRATSVEALTVPADEAGATALRARWAQLDLPVALVELAAPPGQAETAVVEHVAAARRAEPDGLAVVYLPVPTTRRPWRRLLLGQRPERLRERLLVLPGTVVTTVPWPIEEDR